MYRPPLTLDRPLLTLYCPAAAAGVTGGKQKAHRTLTPESLCHRARACCPGTRLHSQTNLHAHLMTSRFLVALLLVRALAYVNALLTLSVNSPDPHARACARARVHVCRARARAHTHKHATHTAPTRARDSPAVNYDVLRIFVRKKTDC